MNPADGNAEARESDVAGARAVGMGSVRFAGRNDDDDRTRSSSGGRKPTRGIMSRLASRSVEPND